MTTDSAPPSGPAIFSLIGGKVWASLPGQSRAIDLGGSEAVTQMMRDFLAQCAIGEKVARERRENIVAGG